MKPQIDFPNVADKLFAEMQSKQYRAKAWNRKKNWAKDNRFSIWERIGIIFGSFVLAICGVCAVIINAHYIDSLPPAVWTIVALAVVALVVGWRIIKSGKKASKTVKI